MPDQKLTELPPVSDPVVGTDLLYLVRGDVSYQVSVDQILAIIPPSETVWGNITGNINDQTDLYTIINGKVDTGIIMGNGQTMTGPGLLGSTGTGETTIAVITIGAGLDLSPGGELSATGGAAVWGAITGTLSSQTDLQSALNAKYDASNPSGYINSLSGAVLVSQASPQTIGSTGSRLAKLWATDITVTNAIAGSVTGNAATATALQTARSINGVNFDGTAGITVTAAAGTLTGTALTASVVTSSLTTVGALASGSLATGFVVGGVTMTLGSDAANDIYYRNSSGVLTRLGMGTTGQYLAANTGAAPTWGTPSGAGTVTHTGSLTANSVVLGNGTADVTVVAGITTDGTSQLNLGVASTTLGKVKLFGNTSGDATIRPAAVAGTATVVTLPNASSTLPIFGQQMTFTGPTAARSVALPDANFTVARTDAGQTFTGTNIFASLNVVGTSNGFTSKIEVDDGSWSAGRTVTFNPGSNANAYVTFPTGVFVVARQDGANTFIGTQTMTSPAFLTSATLDGVAITPQIVPNYQTGDYTAVLSDANKSIVNSGGGTHTWTIPAQGSVNYPVGTTLTFINTFNVQRSIAITTDTLIWLPTNGTGTRVLASYGMATAYKYDSTVWIITGVGLT